MDLWKSETSPALIKGSKASDILNLDESGIFYKTLPGKIFSVTVEDCIGG